MRPAFLFTLCPGKTQ